MTRFSAVLWLHTGKAAWHFVTLPADIADEIDYLTAGNRRGFGSVRVKVTIGSMSWDTSIFPDTKSESFLLPIKAQVRTREDLRDGDTVDVKLHLADLA